MTFKPKYSGIPGSCWIACSDCSCYLWPLIFLLLNTMEICVQVPPNIPPLIQISKNAPLSWCLAKTNQISELRAFSLCFRVQNLISDSLFHLKWKTKGRCMYSGINGVLMGWERVLTETVHWMLKSYSLNGSRAEIIKGNEHGYVAYQKFKRAAFLKTHFAVKRLGCFVFMFPIIAWASWLECKAAEACWRSTLASQ